MGDKAPFFSVLIPTRGRTQVVAWAIQSALDQTFSDLECVVIDNNQDDRVEKICAQFSDSRLRVIKTGGLSMPDNWDQAYLSAHGAYAVLMEDRQCLYRHTLAFVHEMAQREDLQCLVWNYDVFHGGTVPARVRRHGGDRSLRRVRSEDIFEYICGRDSKQDPMQFIHPHRAAVKVSLLEQIRAQTGLKICEPTAPDTTAGLKIMNALETYQYFNGSLSLSHSDQLSNGHNFFRNKNSTNEFFASIGGKEATYTHTPVKACLGDCYNDFLRLSEILGGRLQSHPLDLVYYYTKVAIQLLNSMAEGSDWKEEWTAWKAALAKEPPSLRRAVKKNIRDRTRRRILQQLRIGLGIRAVERMLPKKKKKISPQGREETQMTIPEFVATESQVLAARDLPAMTCAHS